MCYDAWGVPVCWQIYLQTMGSVEMWLQEERWTVTNLPWRCRKIWWNSAWCGYYNAGKPTNVLHLDHQTPHLTLMHSFHSLQYLPLLQRGWWVYITHHPLPQSLWQKIFSSPLIVSFPGRKKPILTLMSLLIGVANFTMLVLCLYNTPYVPTFALCCFAALHLSMMQLAGKIFSRVG